MHSNKKTAITILLIVAGMFAFAFAAFPLYSIFCKATGYGGTPKKAISNEHKIGDRQFRVRFNADVSGSLGWEFKPLQGYIDLKTGENKLAFFYARNDTKTSETGVATFNITPDVAGQYFNKIQCFCFNNQTLVPGEDAKMPVSFFIDPKIEQDPDLKGVDTITLSYTFFKAED